MASHSDPGKGLLDPNRLGRGSLNGYRSLMFPDHRDPTRPLRGSYFYNSIFKPRLTAAGIPVGRPDGIVWHTMRHTMGTWMGLNQEGLRAIMERGRWRSPQMAARYTKVNVQHLEEISARLVAFLDRAKNPES